MTQTKVTEWKTESFEEFIESRLIRGSIDWRRCYFRGQSNSKWGLIPSLLRYKNTPKECENWIEFEELLLDKFKRKGFPFIKDKPQTKLEWLAVAQHNGLPTRLLDWCESPLNALFFAAENLSIKTDFAVWAFYASKDSHPLTDDDELSNLKQTSIYLPNHIDRKISAQQGVFTVHSLPTENTEVSENDILIDSSYGIYKFTFDKKIKASVKGNLDDMGINHFSMFPNLQGLSRNIKWELELMDFEDFHYRRDLR